MPLIRIAMAEHNPRLERPAQASIRSSCARPCYGRCACMPGRSCTPKCACTRAMVAQTATHRSGHAGVGGGRAYAAWRATTQAQGALAIVAWLWRTGPRPCSSLILSTVYIMPLCKEPCHPNRLGKYREFPSPAGMGTGRSPFGIMVTLRYSTGWLPSV